MMTRPTDDTFTDLFARIDFADEPPTHTDAADDVRRGRRRLRRRRAVATAAGALGVCVVSATTALVTSTWSPSIAPLDRDTAVVAPAPATDGFPYPATRAALLDAAREHLDPTGSHLPMSLDEVNNAQYTSDGAVVGTKLGWTIDGEPGLGLVQVATTASGYRDADDHAVADFADDLGCDIGTEACPEGRLPGTDLRTWVVVDAGGVDLGVILERTDGSLVGIAVSDLFGNNTTVPVSEVDVTLEQAYAFVADPDIVVAADDPVTAPSTGDQMPAEGAHVESVE